MGKKERLNIYKYFVDFTFLGFLFSLFYEACIRLVMIKLMHIVSDILFSSFVSCEQSLFRYLKLNFI